MSKYRLRRYLEPSIHQPIFSLLMSKTSRRNASDVQDDLKPRQQRPTVSQPKRCVSHPPAGDTDTTAAQRLKLQASETLLGPRIRTTGGAGGETTRRKTYCGAVASRGDAHGGETVVWGGRRRRSTRVGLEGTC